MVGHEPFLVLKLVEENIFAVNPDIRVPRPSVDIHLPNDLLHRVVLCSSKVWLAELAIAAATPHHFDKAMNRRTHDVRNVLQPRTSRHADNVRTTVEFYIIVYLPDHMIALAHHEMVNAKLFRLMLPYLHLPGPGPSHDKLRLGKPLSSLVDTIDK